jgi:hypothetical protein
VRAWVKWRPIRTSDGYNRKKDVNDNSEKVYALHLETASDNCKAGKKMSETWYGSSKTTFPDGTKMHLVPPYNTILSTANKGKYATLIACQAALSACIGVGTTWDFTTNLLLDRPEPKTKISIRQILMSIQSQTCTGKPVFHTIDKQWHSENVLTLSFFPENETDARTLIAGLVPFIRYSHDPWYMNAFSNEAKVHHQRSRWDHETR